MDATRGLSRNEKLRLINEEIDRLDDLIRNRRDDAGLRRTENAQIDFLAVLRGSRSPQERERYAENKKAIHGWEKTIAESAKAIEKLHGYTENELKTTLRASY